MYFFRYFFRIFKEFLHRFFREFIQNILGKYFAGISFRIPLNISEDIFNECTLTDSFVCLDDISEVRPRITPEFSSENRS